MVSPHAIQLCVDLEKRKPTGARRFPSTQCQLADVLELRSPIPVRDGVATGWGRGRVG